MHAHFQSPRAHRRLENSLPPIEPLLKEVGVTLPSRHTLNLPAHPEIPRHNGARLNHHYSSTDNEHWKEPGSTYQRPQPDPGGPVTVGVDCVYNGYPHEGEHGVPAAVRGDTRSSGTLANHGIGRNGDSDNFPPQLSPTSETASYLDNSNTVNGTDTATVVTEVQSEHGDCSEAYSSWGGDGQRLPGSPIQMYLRKFTCKICRRDFKCESLLRKHDMQHTKPWRCFFPGCKRRDGFTSVNDRDRHMNSVHKQQKGRPAVGYRCKYDRCLNKEKIFWRLDNFRNHVKKKHPNEDVRRAENVCRVEAPSYEMDHSVMDTNSEMGSIATPKDRGLSFHGEESGSHMHYDNANESRHTHQDFSLYSPTSVRTGADIAGAGEMPLFDAMELDEQTSRHSINNFNGEAGADSQGITDTSTSVGANHTQNAGEQAGKTGTDNIKGVGNVSAGVKLRNEKLEHSLKSLEIALMESYGLVQEPEGAEGITRDPQLDRKIQYVLQMMEIYRQFNPTQIPFVSPQELPGEPGRPRLQPSAMQIDDNRSHSMNTFMQQSPRDEAPMSRLLSSSDPPVTGGNDVQSAGIANAASAAGAGNSSTHRRSGSAPKSASLGLLLPQSSSPSARSPRKSAPSDPTANPGTTSPKATPTIGKNGRPVNTERLQCKCDYPGCSSNFRVPSELKKHKKRHSRPYFCTYKGCNKDFGSKNDWKRHENTQHFQLELWKCDVRNVNSTGICGKSSFRKENHVNHLKNTHGITDKAEIAKRTDGCHIGRNNYHGYWCGFCGDEKKRGLIIHLEKKGLEGWDERFDHLEKHFIAGFRMDSYKHQDDGDSGDEGAKVTRAGASVLNAGTIVEGAREPRDVIGTDSGAVGKDRDNRASVMQGIGRSEARATKVPPAVHALPPPEISSNDEVLVQSHVETRAQSSPTRRQHNSSRTSEVYWTCCNYTKSCDMPGPFLAGLNDSCITCQHRRCKDCPSWVDHR